uniref:Uncharacterized protein n=1 Tax=Anguilla anguilla TaxID=7936 RepID=A0A0E9TM70_ANGAN
MPILKRPVWTSPASWISPPLPLPQSISRIVEALVRLLLSSGLFLTQTPSL